MPGKHLPIQRLHPPPHPHQLPVAAPADPQVLGDAQIILPETGGRKLNPFIGPLVETLQVQGKEQSPDRSVCEYVNINRVSKPVGAAGTGEASWAPLVIVLTSLSVAVSMARRSRCSFLDIHIACRYDVCMLLWGGDKP